MAREGGDLIVKTEPSPPSEVDDRSESVVADVGPDFSSGGYGGGSSAATPGTALAMDRPPSIASDVAPLPFMPPGLSEKQEQELTRKYGETLDAQIGERARLKDQIDRDDARYEGEMRQHNAAHAAEGSHLQPWNADREMAARKHDLWEEFGSPAFLVSMMASAFTTMPMVSAMNAGAAAMNAINEGDIENYNRAFKAWEENTKLTLDRMKMEEEEFNNIDKLRTHNFGRWKEDLALSMAKFDDQRSRALLDAGMLPELLNGKKALAEYRNMLADNVPKQIENKALFDGIQGELKTNGGNWFDAYAKTVEKLNRAKNAGKFSGADSALWDRATQLFPGDLNAQADWVESKKATGKGATAASNLEAEKERVRESVIKEWKSKDNADWQDPGKVDLEADKRISEAHGRRGGGISISPETDKRIRDDFAAAIGHDLSPGIEDAINEARAAKGVRKTDVNNDLRTEMNDIKRDLAAGKPLDDDEIERRLRSAIHSATHGASKGVTATFLERYKDEYRKENKEEPSAAKIAEVTSLFATTMATARSLGVREAGIITPIEEVKGLASKAVAAREKVGGGNIRLFNSWEQAMDIARGGKTAEKATELQVRTAGLLLAYSATFARGGTNTEGAQQRALHMLNSADSVTSYKKAVETIRDEMFIVGHAVDAAVKINQQRATEGVEESIKGTGKKGDDLPTIKYDSTGKRIE